MGRMVLFLDVTNTFYFLAECLTQNVAIVVFENIYNFFTPNRFCCITDINDNLDCPTSDYILLNNTNEWIIVIKDIWYISKCL